MRLKAIMLLSICSCALYALEDADRQQIQQRIQPVGKVRVKEDTQTVPQPKAPVAAQGKMEPGQATYEQYCVTCHKDGVAGAPKFRDTAEWKKRQTEKNIDGLLATALKGINAMPPKGTCMDCTDEQLKAAIEYMLPK